VPSRLHVCSILGHEQSAFMKGSKLSADSEDRWNAICQVAASLGIRIRPELIIEPKEDDPSPI
jgi:DNA-binding LacI/PurR family transcriptional regulator